MYFNNKIEKVISNICNCEYEYFLNKKNVVGVGCGYKVKKGFTTNKLCMHVFVSKKVPCNYLVMKDIIPQKYKGILTDVVETGIINSSSFIQKIRPEIGGYVIGNDYIATSSSTLGCLVTDGKDYFILANNHTIASTNAAPLGTKIIQPSIRYGGNVETDVIGTLFKYIPIKFKTFLTKPTNYVDCAVAKVVDKALVSEEIAMIGIPKGTANPKLKLPVKKSGFKSELTTGEITDIHVVATVPYKRIGKSAIFKEQIMATYMSDTGDSGSVVLDDNNNVVGLIMAKTQNRTVFNPIDTVLKELNVNLVT